MIFQSSGGIRIVMVEIQILIYTFLQEVQFSLCYTSTLYTLGGAKQLYEAFDDGTPSS